VYLDGFSYEGKIPKEEFDKKYKTTQTFGCPIWHQFYTGYSDKMDIISYQKYKELNLDKFNKELNLLLKKYNVNINFGCGCCGAGMNCGELEFSWEEEDVNE
jgi:hypothetical protein